MQVLGTLNSLGISSDDAPDRDRHIAPVTSKSPSARGNHVRKIRYYIVLHADLEFISVARQLIYHICQRP